MFWYEIGEKKNWTEWVSAWIEFEVNLYIYIFFVRIQ